MNLSKNLLSFAAAGIFAASGLEAGTLAPGGFLNTEADSSGAGILSSGAPFASPRVTGRMQDFYDSSLFSVFGSGQYITQIAFRDDSGNPPDPNTVTLGNILVQLSSSSKTGGTLSSTFSDNLNSDAATVYSGGITFSEPFDAGAPRSFGYVIPLQTPFFYNPAKGGLVVDIEVIKGWTGTSSGVVPVLDFSRSTSTFGTVIDESSSPTGYADLAGPTVGGEGFPILLTYQSTLSSTPEPASLLLFGSGTLALLGLAAIRKRRA